jgi:hypothetical protein
MRDIPWAAWDSERRLWNIPYRSWEELRRRWPAIEAAARRNEPEARRRRAQDRQGTGDHEAARARARELRLRRYPVPADDLPPIGRIVMTRLGAVAFLEVSGECVEPVQAEVYGVPAGINASLVWARWERPSLADLVKAWPARRAAEPAELRRGWWRPTLEELREERRTARSLERARATRLQKAGPRPTSATAARSDAEPGG